MTLTKGYGIINHSYKEYRKKENTLIGKRKNGALVSIEQGKSTLMVSDKLKVVEHFLFLLELKYMKE